MFFSHRF
jgi:hypothetical protein